MTGTNSAVRTVRWPVLGALMVSLAPAFYVARLEWWTSMSGVRHQVLFDDAMISMSYARTLASGHGLVWYPGAARVEGVTNLGWTLVMAAVHATGFDGDTAVAAMKIIGLLTVWGAALVACCIGRSFAGAEHSAARFFTCLSVAANLPLLFWTIQGMEVGAFTLLALLVCLLCMRVAWRSEHSALHQWCLSVVVVAGIVIRADFAVVAMAALVWAIVVARKRFLALALPLCVGTAFAICGTVAFRLAYYGDPFPNTYYLKLTGVPLDLRFERGVVVAAATTLAYLLPSLVIVAAAWRRLRSLERRAVAMLGTISAALAVYAAFVGGDAWEFMQFPDRYLTPAVALGVVAACLSAFSALADVGAPLARHWWLVAVVVTGLASAGGLVTSTIYWMATRHEPNLVLGSSRAFAFKGSVAALALGALALGTAALVSRQRPARAGIVLAAALTVVLLVAIAPQVERARNESRYGTSSFAALGEQLAFVTDRRAAIAVGGAGGTQYVARRPMIDMLGKSDRHVAHMRPRDPWFLPGHNKWDLAYSIGRLRPDVVAHPPATDAQLRRWGYVPMRLRDGSFSNALSYGNESVVYVQPDSPHVRFARLVPVDTE